MSNHESNSMIPSIDEIKAIETIAKKADESKYFTTLGGLPGIFSIAMYAKEMGLPIMSSLFGGMQNIQGKIQISPQLMNSMIRKAGHKMEVDANDQRCIIKGTRKDTGESCTVTFGIEDAKKAGIYKNAWEKYPSDMCFARAMSRLARRLFADVIGNAYVEGEIEETKELDKKDDVTTIESSEPEMDIPKLVEEFTLYFGPMEKKEGQLTEYVKICCKSSNLLPHICMKKALEQKEEFGSFFKKWMDKPEKKKENSVVETQATLV